MQDRQQCRDMAEGVREAGYDVIEYQTGREFLIDKGNHNGGIVLAEFRLYGMLGDELVKELVSERETFPVVLIATPYDGPRAVRTGVDFIARGPSLEVVLEAIRRTETPEIFDERSLRWGFEKLMNKVPGHSDNQSKSHRGISKVPIVLTGCWIVACLLIFGVLCLLGFMFQMWLVRGGR